MMKGDELSSHTYYNLYLSRVYDTLCAIRGGWWRDFFSLLFGITKTHQGGCTNGILRTRDKFCLYTPGNGQLMRFIVDSYVAFLH